MPFRKNAPGFRSFLKMRKWFSFCPSPDIGADKAEGLV